MQQKIKNINNEITDLNALNNELDYFEKTRDILIKYYQHEHKLENMIDVDAKKCKFINCMW